MEGNPYEIYLLSLNVEYCNVFVVLGIREVIHLVLIVPPQTAKLFLSSCLTSFGTLLPLRSNNGSAACHLRIVTSLISQHLYIFTPRISVTCYS